MKKNEMLKSIYWVIFGVLVTSFIAGIIFHQYEVGHRNFEYVQCRQFWELAISTNRTDRALFDCMKMKEEIRLFKNKKHSECKKNGMIPVGNFLEVSINQFYAVMDELESFVIKDSEEPKRCDHPDIEIDIDGQCNGCGKITRMGYLGQI